MIFNCTKEEIENEVMNKYPGFDVVFHDYDYESFNEYGNQYGDKELMKTLELQYIGGKKKMKISRLANNFKDIDENNSNIEEYVDMSSKWNKVGVGLYEYNEDKNTVLDTNSYSIMLYTDADDIYSIDGCSKISSDSYFIKSLSALKQIENLL